MKHLIRLVCTNNSITLNKAAAQVLHMPVHIFPLIDCTDDSLYIMNNILQSVSFSGEQNPEHPYAMPLKTKELSDGGLCVVSPAVLLQQIQKACKFHLEDHSSYVFVGTEKSYIGAPALKFSLKEYMAGMPTKHDPSSHALGER